jgi:hypothetical protein
MLLVVAALPCSGSMKLSIVLCPKDGFLAERAWERDEGGDPDTELEVEAVTKESSMLD